MKITSFESIPGMAILINFKKAFDSIDWNFLAQVLEGCNCGPQIWNWIKTFYTKISSCVVNNGHASEFFNKSKTEGMWLGSCRYNTLTPFDTCITWPSEPIYALGTLSFKKIFEEKLNSMKKLGRHTWIMRVLLQMTAHKFTVMCNRTPHYPCVHRKTRDA